MMRKLLAVALTLFLVVGVFPAAASPAYAAGTTTGVSELEDDVYGDLGFDVDSVELANQARDELTPYGRGQASLLTRHELMYVDHAGDGDAFDVNKSGDRSYSKSGSTSHDFADGDAFRSVAFDPFGSGKANYIAVVSAMMMTNGDTEITLSIDSTEKDPDGNDFKTLSIPLCTLPFKVYAENAGAWLSVAAGNFDGDPLGTEEIAVYQPCAGSVSGDNSPVKGATIEIYRLEENIKVTFKTVRPGVQRQVIGIGSGSSQPRTERVETFLGYELIPAGTLDLDKRVSSYYFSDHTVNVISWLRFLGSNYKTRDWTYQYLLPALSLETVKQPGDAADDLCATVTAALGGGVAKLAGGVEEFNAKRPYDSATGVFFWIDPLTPQQKNTHQTQLRFNWKDDYKVATTVDKDAAKKYDVMVFGSPGAGDINGNGYQEVVVGGYLMNKRDQAMDGKDKDDWKISTNEYVATYFTYDPKAKSYSRAKQCMNWVSILKKDYNNASAMGEGIYSNYGEKDMMHNPLPVTCFAERGGGYPDSVAIGGVVCLLDTDSGVSDWLPYSSLTSYNFEHGAFNPRYAIPTEIIHTTDGFNKGIQNRLFTETVAGNFDGNALGQEQLAFVYVGKVKEKSQWSSAYGIIGQRMVGEPDNVYNVNDNKKNHLGSDVSFKFWKAKTNDGRYAPASVCAADTDDDSALMRYSGKPNEYFFSDPRIIAVLQATPFFKDLDYTDAGATSIQFTEGTSEEEEHGLSVGIQIQVGFEAEDLLGLNGLSVKAGVSTEFEKTWGSGSSRSYSLEYAAGQENSVALVMTPYVRYHYETYDPKKKTWSPMIVDTPQSPRASIITLDKYDAVAEMQGWEAIGGNVLKNSSGYPGTYGSSTSGKKNLMTGKAVGAQTGSNFVKVGAGDSAGSMAQTISAETTKFSNMSWSVTQTLDIEAKKSGVVVGVGQSMGYTGSSSRASFEGYDYVGEVTNLPAGADDYSFAWQFVAWEDSVNTGKDDQKFPVLGYLVKDVMQPPTYPETLHVAKAEPDALTLAWQLPMDMVGISSGVYTLYRYQDGVYYPLFSAKEEDNEEGWFTFEDVKVLPYKEYLYSVQTRATVGGNRYMDSPYSPLLYAYTPPEGSNVPKAVLTWSTKAQGGGFEVSTTAAAPRELSVQVTPATGDVGGILLQWQRYEPEEGGWIDLVGPDASKQTIGIAAADVEVGALYRCRVSQRVETEIFTVYTEALQPKFMAKKGSAATASGPVVKLVINREDVDYKIYSGTAPGQFETSTSNNYTKSYPFASGTVVNLLLYNDFPVSQSSVDLTESGGEGMVLYTFTMPTEDVTITIGRQ